MPSETAENLDSLFYPRSIAVVGASPKRQGRGNQWISGFLRHGFRGRIYPVHPSADYIMSLKTYKSVRDIPEELDLVVFAIPYTAAPAVMKDCAAKGVKYVHMFTAGFSETGEPELIRLEEELIEIAKEGNVRVVGPNCMGLYCTEGGVTWMEDFPLTPGPVGFISQSGQLASQFIMEGSLEKLRFSKVVSFGNAADLQFHDFLNYLAHDDKTKYIGAYIEGLKDGRSFFEAAKKVTRKKPLIVFKGGQTEGGARATQSHTASIAGSANIWQSLCRQTGIISVNSLHELISTIVGFQHLDLPEGRRVAILGGAGGGSVTMTDIAEKEGLLVPQLSDDTIKDLKEIIPVSGNSVQNPLDIGFSTVYQNREQFLKLYDLLRHDPNIDALLYSRGIFRRRGSGGRADLDFLTKMTLEGIKVIKKPVLVVQEGGRSLEWEALREEAQSKYQNAGVPTFDSFQSAARVLSNLYKYKQFLDSSE
ncbi:MAG: CoA-binding protein [Deltaproteobacteria bacterium]|nr:CoA-binding protein [Deltaproteobacteria bacterium]